MVRLRWERAHKYARSSGRARLGQLLAVIVAHDRTGDAHAVQVALHALQPLLRELVRKDDARVAHQRREVRGLAAGRGGHVDDGLAGLGREREARQERRRALQWQQENGRARAWSHLAASMVLRAVVSALCMICTARQD
jgi:hypothetical protein